MKRFTISMLAIAVSATIGISQAQAQCSRGQGSSGGGAPSQFSGGFAQSSFMPRSPLNMTAYQMQQIQLQQQIAAMRIEQFQRIAQQRNAQQQAVYANRLARAEAKRAKRAERVAALKARQDTESDEPSVMLASRTQARTGDKYPTAPQ